MLSHAKKIRDTWPVDRITTSTDLPEYLKTKQPTAGTAKDPIYLSDTHTWVVVDFSHNDSNNTIGARQSPGCYQMLEYRPRGAHEFWEPWHAVTPCNGGHASSSGGSVTWTEGTSVVHSLGGHISVGDPLGIVGAAFSFGVSWEISMSVSTTCNYGAGESGQVWGRHRMGWAVIQRNVCQYCNFTPKTCAGWLDEGWINVPANNANPAAQQWGCSTSSVSYLKCDESWRLW